MTSSRSSTWTARSASSKSTMTYKRSRWRSRTWGRGLTTREPWIPPQLKISHTMTSKWSLLDRSILLALGKQ
jgi:hypothetical protein